MRSWAERSFNSQPLQLLLAAVVAMNVIPFATETPMWVIAVSSGFIAWSVAHSLERAKLPSRYARWFFAAGSMGATYAQFGSIIGQEPASALLILLASLKLLETVRYRDAMYVTFISYFLLMDYVLISQTLTATVFMIASIAAITTLLFYLHGNNRKLSVSSLKRVARTLWLAVPIWIFLFVVFPRFSAALWTIDPKTTATTGFSDELNPGDIAQLVDSDQIAFRATFTSDNSPRYEDLYWRGGILWQSEGLRWTKRGFLPGSSVTTRRSSEVEQEIVLEPIFNRFVFGLDSPIAMSAAGQSTRALLSRPGFVFERVTPASIRTLYIVRSTVDSDEPELKAAEEEIFLQVPESTNEIQSLISEIKRSTSINTGNLTPEEKISNAVIRYFLNNGFRYTKTPGTMSTLNEFLFNKRVGFCEHYASAYATLMRFAGVPSRVVIGFHGGARNRFADHMTVRALDAHAWAEIFEKGRGWKRVDPTSYIVPLRQTLGGDFNLVDSNALSRSITREQFEYQLHGAGLAGWLNDFSLAADLISSSWNNFLLRYDFDYQSSVLNRLGVRSGQRAWLMSSLILGTILLLLLIRLWLARAPKSKDPLLSAYREFYSELRSRGLPKSPSEGPIDYSRRAAQAWPTKSHEIEDLLRQYAVLRYGSVEIQKLQAIEWRKRARALYRTLVKIK